MNTKSLIFLLPVLLIACEQQGEEISRDNVVSNEPSSTDSTTLDSSSQAPIIQDDYVEEEPVKNLCGTWFCNTPIINQSLDPDIDGLFDVDELKMSRLKGSFEPDFNGVVFWLERDSSVKVATNYKPADESKSYFDRYSSSYFKESIWHHHQGSSSLMLEFHFNDGAEEISEIYYKIGVKDQNQIRLRRLRNNFYVEGEEDYF